MAMPQLKELQSWMRWIITDPRGVKEALREPRPQIHSADRFTPKNFDKYLKRYTEPEPACLTNIQNTEVMSREDRLDVYAEGYFLRICEALKEDFPALLRLLDDAGFLQIAADYLKEYPSQFTNLADVGHALPEFLKCHEVSSDLPYVVDLAELEWAVNQAIYSPNPPLLASQHLQKIAQENLPYVRFKLHPSYQLLSSQWGVETFWRGENNEISPCADAMNSGTHTYYVLNIDGNVTVTTVEEVQALALKQMAEGETLAEMCQSLEETNSSYDESAVQNWFSSWIQTGLIYDIGGKNE